ncbi:MAG TPA: AmmeMemoRadiSam system radical SAM enzyme [Syntrophales bacterium]|nr:AmmeMemoRadiSam system radical SAM enzyme [Syntrophales bacterium]
MTREAMLFEPLADGQVRCLLCAHRCLIKEGRRGICGVRENCDGVLYSLVYGAVIAENIDPIEKKPFFHLHPGSRSYSLATVGCNFRCRFCQNHEISQLPREAGTVPGKNATPAEIVARAVDADARTIAYTYTEPTVFFEFAYDISRLARERGIKNVFVTNGYLSEEALATISPYLDGANVDLKSFRDDFYRQQCGARLQPVLDTLVRMKTAGIWVEVTTLLIPGLNDSEEEIDQIAAFLAGLGKETPWHISRFHPRYQMNDLPATPRERLQKAREIGRAQGLKYVYSGNVPGDEGENTFCPGCGRLLIGRYGFCVESMMLRNAACMHCGTPLDGVF